MTSDDPQQIWSAYYQRKKAQRIAEASQLWTLMESGGVTPETDLALDFVHFGARQADVEDLAKQLSENYEMKVVRSADGDAWLAKGTTRPYGINLIRERQMAWVEFMADVSQSYGCVFSTWSVEAPSLDARFDSEQVDGDD